MMLFRPSQHIGTTPKLKRKWRYCVHEISCNSGNWIVRDTWEPGHKTFKSTSKIALKRVVRIMNRGCVP